MTQTTVIRHARAGSTTTNQEGMNRPTVVIAEDNPGLARVLAFKFERCGFRAIIGGDGLAALQAIDSNKVDAVVSDVEMPRMTGLDLFRNIRQRNRRMPLFLLSGRLFDESTSNFDSELGITAVFCKPFSPSQVVAQVREALT